MVFSFASDSTADYSWQAGWLASWLAGKLSGLCLWYNFSWVIQTIFSLSQKKTK